MRLSAFNQKTGQFYWQVKEVEPAFEGKPCFTKGEMKNFEEMREDEIRMAFKLRLDFPAVGLAFPKDWRMFRIAERAPPPDTAGAQRAKEILEMLRGIKS